MPHPRERIVNPADVLDDSEGNLGNSATPRCPADGGVFTPQRSESIILLKLERGASQKAKPITINISAQLPQDLSTPAIYGPITGIVEFGNGGSQPAVVEFDIPTPSVTPAPLDPDDYPGSLSSVPQSGISLSIAASSIKVSARNDNNLRPVYEGVNPNAIWGAPITSGRNPEIKASAAYGPNMDASRGLKKTIVLVKNTVAAPNPLPDTDSVTFGIPNFAKSFFIIGESWVAAIRLRQGRPAVQGLTTVVETTVGHLVPIELDPVARIITLTNISGADISDLIALFNLSL